MMAGMELRHLRYFTGVAEALNFTRAAQKLRVAQPALSRQIRQLEDEVGVRLLERNRRSVQLTEAGRVFLAEARSILAQSSQAVLAARAGGQPMRGALNLGYIWGMFHSLAPAVVTRFRREFPDAAVNLFDLTATQQTAALREGKLDAGFIGYAGEADGAGLSCRKVGRCALVAALPKKHPAARRRVVPLRELAQEFFFVISEENYPGAARCVIEACGQAGFRPKVLQTAARGHTILGLVAGNCGVALLPDPLRALPHPGVVFRPLAEPVLNDLFIAWSPGRPSALRDAFVHCASRQWGATPKKSRSQIPGEISTPSLERV
jgi:DNA-binding transcriptional LysR family regulator